MSLSIEVDPIIPAQIDTSQTMATGWYFDVAGNISPMFGVVFQVVGNYKTIEQTLTVPPLPPTRPSASASTSSWEASG